MADLPTINLSGAQKDINAALDAAIGILNSHHNDTTPPSNPVVGGLYRINGVWQVWNGSSYDTALVDLVLRAALSGNGQQIQNFRHEKLDTNDIPAAGSGNQARPFFDQILERKGYVTTAGRFYETFVDIAGATKVRIPAELNVASLANAADASAATPLGGWLIDDALKGVNVKAKLPVPAGYSDVPAAGKDIKLQVEFMLAAVEAANDTNQLAGSWQSLSDGQAPGADTLAFDGTTAPAHSIGSGTAQYARHVMELTLDHDGLVTDIAAGDTLLATLTHPASLVGSIIITNAWFHVPVLNFNS